jgi:hypothetical protein
MTSERAAEAGAPASDGTTQAVTAWFGERLPSEWTHPTPAQVTVDREEIIVILTVSGPPEPEPQPQAEAGAEAEPGSPASASTDTGKAAKAEAIAGRIARFREETRDRRIAIAREAEHRFGRKVAWGVESGGVRQIFTSLAIPVMTRLRQSERLVLDTLVDAGVARSRAHGVAWCVRLVGDNAATWLTDLRSAMAEVEKVRDSGPASSR